MTVASVPRPIARPRVRRPVATHRCTARNRRGEPCQAWPIHGATVCVAHGGRAPQVRAAAAKRVTEAQALAALQRASDRHQRDRQAWHARRVALVARLMGIPATEVTWAAIAVCVATHGQPDEPEPKITDARYRS